MQASSPVKEDVIQQQILQAAKQLFRVHGLRKVTMDDVAKAIGKGRSSLYYYYKSKEEILEAVIDVEIKDILASIKHAIAGAPTAEQKINAFFITKLKVVHNKGAFFSAIDIGMDAEEMLSYNKTKHRIHTRIMKDEGELLKQILTVGITTGELSEMNEKDQDTLIFVLLSSLHGIKREMITENDYSRIEPTINMLTHAIMHGLKK